MVKYTLTCVEQPPFPSLTHLIYANSSKALEKFKGVWKTLAETFLPWTKKSFYFLSTEPWTVWHSLGLIPNHAEPFQYIRNSAKQELFIFFATCPSFSIIYINAFHSLFRRTSLQSMQTVRSPFPIHRDSCPPLYALHQSPHLSKRIKVMKIITSKALRTIDVLGALHHHV